MSVAAQLLERGVLPSFRTCVLCEPASIAAYGSFTRFTLPDVAP